MRFAPTTLRDLRRLVGRGRVWDTRSPFPRWPAVLVATSPYAWRGGALAPGCLHLHHMGRRGDVPGWAPGEDLAVALDRLISQFGPDCPFPIPEEATKGKANEDGPVGPNGDSEQEAGQHSKEGTGSESESSPERGEGSHPAVGKNGGSPTDGNEAAAGEPTGRVAPGRGDVATAEGDTPAHGGPDVARPKACAHHGESTAGDDSEGGGDDTPADVSEGLTHGSDPCPDWGGIYADLAADVPPSDPAARRLKRVLERLVSLFGVGDGVEIPRIHPGRLVRELVSRRVALSRCRREVTSEIIVIAADVSGSCAGVADETLAAARMMAVADPRIVVVAHSNGVPMQVWGAEQHRVTPRLDVERVGRGYNATDATRFTVDGPVALLVAFGDGDAEDVYRARAELHPVVWLDHHGCSRSPIPRIVEDGGRLVRIVGIGGVAQAAAAADLLARRRG